MNRGPGVSLVVVALAVAATAVAPGSVVANHGVDSVNHSVAPGDPAPGAEEVSYVFEAELVGNFDDGRSGIEEPTRVVFSLGAGDVSGCASNIGVVESYTLTITNQNGEQEEMDAEASFDGGTAEFDISDPSNTYTVKDVIRLELDECVTNPGEAGWYQAEVVVEGKAFGSDEQVSVSESSHYFAICEGCDNESAAREELGPPPSQQSESTPTPTPTPTPTEASSGGGPFGGVEPFGGGEGPLGVDPLVVVGLVAAVSIGVAVFGATRL